MVPAVLLLACMSCAVEASAAKKAVSVALGQEFRLEKGGVARIARSRDSIRITGFVNSPCPKGAMCVWSGLAVLTELTVNGKVLPQGSKDSPYDVTVNDSDYRSYALLVVDRPERVCAAMDPLSRPECLRSLAQRRSDPGLCKQITDSRTRGFCLEDLAAALKKDELCRDVASPTQYCRYVRSKATGDLAACIDIVTFSSRVRCVKELSTEGGGGPRSCAELPPEPARLCRELASGPDN